MPAQKRPLEEEDNNDLLPQNHTDDDNDDNNNSNNNNDDDDQKQQQQQDNDEGALDEPQQQESDQSSSDSDCYRDQEFIMVRLADIRKEVQCPICLGIIRKTRTVMECLHRFCRECIDKSMRMGNNECPACRTHCASRRSLRDDPNYDALISTLYPDIDKYEEEELALQEEEKARTKQIQASIAQTLKRQTDAACRKRSAKGSKKTYNRPQDASMRSKRNYRSENQGSDEKEDGNEDEGKDSSSADERSAEVRPKRGRRLGGRFGQFSSAVNRGGDEIDSEATKDSMGLPAAFAAADRLSWGKGGIRSQSRHGSTSGGNSKSRRNSRISKLIDQFKSLEENEPEMSIMLVSLNGEGMPKLKEPYICCSPTLSVQQLCQYVSFQIGVNRDELELYVVTELNSEVDAMSGQSSKFVEIVASKDKLRVLEEKETMEGLNMHISYKGHTVLGYQKKLQTS